MTAHFLIHYDSALPDTPNTLPEIPSTYPDGRLQRYVS